MSKKPAMITDGNAPADDEKGMSLFSTRRPRDALAGLSSAFKNVGKGVAAGVGALVALPVAGAKEEGAKGFAKGLATGAMAAVAFPAAGLLTGAVQLGRGVFNTPEAVRERMDEKVWDPEKRVWYAYNLPDEAAEVMMEKAESEACARTNVVETEFYDLLGVATNASRAQIKKAYYRQAMLCHPDKNPDDVAAKEKFQKIGNAYQVLMDDNLRASYDQQGKDGIDGNKLLDSSQLLEIVFGSEKFESLVGELRLMMMQNMNGLNDEELDDLENEDMDVQIQEISRRQAESDKVMKTRQRQREVRCAMNLVGMIDGFVHRTDDGSAFKSKMEEQAKELTSTSFGGALVRVVGYVYDEEAKRYLGFKHGIGHGLGIGKFKKTGHTLANKYRVASSLFQTFQISRREEAKKKKKRDSIISQASQAEHSSQSHSGNDAATGTPPASNIPVPDADEAKTEEASPEDMMPPPDGVNAMISTLWHVTVLDVENTLRSVCRKLFKDSSVSLEERQLRAEALIIVGTVFQEAGQSAEAGLSEFQAMLESQYRPPSEHHDIPDESCD